MLEIGTLGDLLGHPAAGPSYETFVVESVVTATDLRPFHYRTAKGDEVDLVLVRSGRPFAAVEVTRSTSPTVGAVLHRACDDLDVAHRFVVRPDTGAPEYTSNGARVFGHRDFIRLLRGGDLGAS